MGKVVATALVSSSLAGVAALPALAAQPGEISDAHAASANAR